MKIKILLYTALIFSASLTAQTSKQRESIRKANNNAEISKLEKKFKAQYDADELNVKKYLIENPSLERYYKKNGSIYFIKSINKDGKPVIITTKSNVGSGELIKANSLYGGGSIGANITGTGMVAGVWDGGQVRATHELLTGQVTMQAVQTLESPEGNDHMTHVTGTMVGKDIGNSAKGIAYNATARCYDWDNDLDEMRAFAAAGFFVSNHSYGYPNNDAEKQKQWEFGAYDKTASDWDELTKTTPYYLPFVAGGIEQITNVNGKTGELQGYDVITGSSASKNVVTVGAVNADRTMSSYSNFGPTDDGRIKPDVCARGTGINSSLSTSDTAYSGDALNGTSYATPAAAASALLLQQYYYSLKKSWMTASMLKALLLHSADDEGNPGPDNKFGWGIINIEEAANIIKNSNDGGSDMSMITTNPLNDDTDVIGGTGIETENMPVRFSFCWTDDDGIEQDESDGIDNPTSRLVYNFKPMVRNETDLADFYPWLDSNISDPTADVLVATSFSQEGRNNYKQINVTNINSNSLLSLYIKKTSSSPVKMREIAMIVKGLKVKDLKNSKFIADNNPIVFHDKTSGILKLISDKIFSFNEFSIFDISGKQLQKGLSTTKELNLANYKTGVYFINFVANNKNYNVKFLVQ